jgi:hypothetical protein
MEIVKYSCFLFLKKNNIFNLRACQNSFYNQEIQSMLPTLAQKSDEIFGFFISCSHELMTKLKKKQRKIMVNSQKNFSKKLNFIF